MRLLKIFITILYISLVSSCFGQTDSIVPIFKDALKARRSKQYSDIVKNIILKNLQLPITDSTEDNWMSAFDAMEILQYKEPWVIQKIQTGFDSSQKRSVAFRLSLAQLVEANFPSLYLHPLKSFLETNDISLFASCADYLLKYDSSIFFRKNLDTIIHQKFKDILDTQIIKCLLHEVSSVDNFASQNEIASFLKKDFLPGNIVMYSFQRKNRNYPGLAIIRDNDGNFINDTNGKIFNVPQLARSILNCAYFLPNGNTPQGIYKMNGLAVSKAYSIGPTPNVQLKMPFETSLQKFFCDSTIADTLWTEEWYKKLLPEKLKNYFPLYGSFFASKVGRTEIIAHGTTVNPAYYKDQPYYPHTPTEGCLNTIELWSEENGKRIYSDQEKLVNAFRILGNAHGYCIVIELNDEQKPVTLQNILPFINSTNEN